MAANINQIAKKRNNNEELDAFQRAYLKRLPDQIKEFLTTIEPYFK